MCAMSPQRLACISQQDMPKQCGTLTPALVINLQDARCPIQLQFHPTVQKQQATELPACRQTDIRLRVQATGGLCIKTRAGLCSKVRCSLCNLPTAVPTFKQAA